MTSRVPEVTIHNGDMVRMTRTGRYGDQTMITLTEDETVELIDQLHANLREIRNGRALAEQQISVPADPATWSGYQGGSGSHGSVYDDDEAAAANQR